MPNDLQQVQLTSWPSGESQPIAVLSIEPEDLERNYGLIFEDGVDELDVFREAIVRTKSGRLMMFIRYRNHPNPGTHVHADVGDDASQAVAELLQALELDATVLSWTKSD